jgi:hypothetical protein
MNQEEEKKKNKETPRAIYLLTGITPLQVTVLCLQDLMNPITAVWHIDSKQYKPRFFSIC